MSLLNHNRNIKYTITNWNAMLTKVQFMRVLLDVLMRYEANSSVNEIRIVHATRKLYIWKYWVPIQEQWFNIKYVRESTHEKISLVWLDNSLQIFNHNNIHRTDIRLTNVYNKSHIGRTPFHIKERTKR